MEQNKEKYEQFETEPKSEEIQSVQKAKKKTYKRIRNILLILGIIIALYIIYQKTNQVKNLQKSIEEEKRRREEQKKILMDSTIIAGSIEEKETIRKWINPEISFQTKLLYRLSRDGSSIFNFHSKCDNKAPTLLLVESHDQNKFGAYTTASFEMFSGIYKNGTKSFLFSLTRNKKYERKTDIKYTGDIFSGSRDVGPWYGIHDLYFYGTMNDCYSYKYSGQCLFLDGHGIVDRTNVDNSIGVKEVELYQIIFRS
jgi:hypothetical protein